MTHSPVTLTVFRLHDQLALHTLADLILSREYSCLEMK